MGAVSASTRAVAVKTMYCEPTYYSFGDLGAHCQTNKDEDKEPEKHCRRTKTEDLMDQLGQEETAIA